MTVTDLTTRRGGGDHTRTPPHDTHAEEALLGAMLLTRDAIDTAAEHLTPGDFYNLNHAHIYDAITTLHSTGQPADPVTVSDVLRGHGLLDQIGGPATLVRLQAGTPATTNAGRYTATIANHSLRRSLIAAAGEIAEHGYTNADGHEAADQAEALLLGIANRRTTDTTVTLADALAGTIDQIEARQLAGGGITGTPTGYTDLDELLGGSQPEAFTVLGARPSAGKTAFALGAAGHAAIEHHTPVLLFSLEMGKLELTTRLIASEAQVDSKRLARGLASPRDWERITAAVGRISDAPLVIDDDPGLTINKLRAKARRFAQKYGQPGLIVIDYIQLMTGRGSAENRQVELAEVSRGLKILARELRCPVWGLSQLSRALELRADKRPMLSDLRETGSLEQDADVVIFIYRDEIYHPNSEDRGTAEILVAKHRAGPTGVTRMAFLEQYTQFANLARSNAG